MRLFLMHENDEIVNDNLLVLIWFGIQRLFFLNIFVLCLLVLISDVLFGHGEAERRGGGGSE